eukprot:6665808-Prymnesium_polylepis.1
MANRDKEAAARRDRHLEQFELVEHAVPRSVEGEDGERGRDVARERAERHLAERGVASARALEHDHLGVGDRHPQQPKQRVAAEEEVHPTRRWVHVDDSHLAAQRRGEGVVEERRAAVEKVHRRDGADPLAELDPREWRRDCRKESVQRNPGKPLLQPLSSAAGRGLPEVAKGAPLDGNPAPEADEVREPRGQRRRRQDFGGVDHTRFDPVHPHERARGV